MQQIDPQWAWNEFEPTESQPWNRRAATHLFRRAGFAASVKKLDEALTSTPADAVRKLIAEDAKSTNFETQADALARTVIAGGDPKQLAAAWVYRLLYTPAQLLEKTTLFWHGHFATGAEKVQVAEMMWDQNQLLRENALGEFEPLVQAISRDPAMLIYLDSTTNRKAHPNENYARELMELFCLGEGNYNEQDVQQLARCFTGWEIKNKKFRENSYQHDTGTKQLLGKSGDFDGEDAVRVVLEQDAMPYFIVGKLVRYFVFDEPKPTRELLKPLADQFRAGGLKIGPTVARILGSNLFFSEHALARKVRSPIELAVGFLRALEGTTNTVRLADNLTKLGHGLFYPPNVKGWDGGRAWINSSTLLGRANLVRDILNHESTKFANGSLETYVQSQKLDSPQSIVHWFSELLLAVPLSPDIETQLVKLLGSSPKENQLREVLHTISTLPEFQLL